MGKPLINYSHLQRRISICRRLVGTPTGAARRGRWDTAHNQAVRQIEMRPIQISG